MGGGT
jgi:hypothetical protein